MMRDARPRNAGAAALQAGGWSLDRIATDCEVGRTTADRWRRGEKVPNADARVRLSRPPYRIARDAWDWTPEQPKKTKPRKHAASRETPAARSDRVDTASELRDQVARYRLMLEDDRLSPDARVKAERGLSTVLTALARLDGIQITESTIVRHPAFRRVMAAVLSALEPFPAALRAVADVLHAREG